MSARFILTFVLLLHSVTLWAQNAYLVRELNRLINVTSTLNDPSNPDCEIYDEPSALPSVNMIRTREVQACYRPGNEPLPFRGLQPNQHMLMTQDNYRRENGALAGIQRGLTTGNYLLRRLNDVNFKPQYEAIMNVNFQGSDTLTSYMRDKSKKCLREITPYLRGPNGEQLRLKILSPEETEALQNVPKPAPINIAVSMEGPSYRGNAGQFGTNFSCSTITHEFLHHLGLCVEYYEGVLNDTRTGVTGDYSCRPVTVTTSVMRDKNGAFNSVVPQTSRCSCDEKCNSLMNHQDPGVKALFLSMNGYDVMSGETSLWGRYCQEGADVRHMGATPDRAFSLGKETEDNVTVFHSYNVAPTWDNNFMVWRREITCTCPVGHPYCQRMVNEFKKKASASIPRTTCPSGTKPKDIEPSIGNQGVSRVEGEGENRELIITTQASGSLLRAQHFYKIISGNCAGGAPFYDACAPYANLPLGAMCSSMPTFCGQDEMYLDGPPGRPVSRQ